MEIEVGSVLLCTVERIAGTIVFVTIDGTKKSGTIVFSEVSPGRIRNIRDFVVPKKKIICKVLRIIDNTHLDLSLRRVTKKEQKEVMDEFKQEKSYQSILKTILKDKTKEIVDKITKEERLFDFIEEAKTDSKKLEKLIGKENSEKLLTIVKSQKTKTAILKKEFSFSTTEPNGLEIIKKYLGDVKDLEIKYISAGKYNVKAESENIKDADKKIKEFSENLEKEIKGKNIIFNLKDK